MKLNSLLQIIEESGIEVLNILSMNETDTDWPHVTVSFKHDVKLKIFDDLNCNDRPAFSISVPGVDYIRRFSTSANGLPTCPYVKIDTLELRWPKHWNRFDLDGLSVELTDEQDFHIGFRSGSGSKHFYEEEFKNALTCVRRMCQ